jgi:cyclic beta-1,2-glucan synthetase
MSVTKPSSPQKSLLRPASDRAPATDSRPQDGADRLTSHALLSNGKYQVQIAADGRGRSRWNGIDITRWRPDIHAAQGVLLFLKDIETDAYWPIPVDGHAAALGSDIVILESSRADIGAVVRIMVHPELSAEVRYVELTNRGDCARSLELTSYVELALAPHGADRSHPAFSKLFVQTTNPEPNLLMARRRPRSAGEDALYAAHLLLMPAADKSVRTEFETSRLAFIGRNRTVATATAFDGRLTGALGSVLDPIFSHRVSIDLAAGETAMIGFAVMAALTEAEILQASAVLVADTGGLESARKALDARARELRELAITHADEVAFQELAVRLLDGSGFATPSGIGSSDDGNHVVRVNVTSPEGSSMVVRLLGAGKYLRRQGISNYKVVAYLDMHEAAAEVMSARFDQKADPALTVVTRTGAGSNATMAEANGAAITIDSFRGTLYSQLIERYPAIMLIPAASDWEGERSDVRDAPDPLPEIDLVARNGYGGFTNDGREYVIDLSSGVSTPAPWINAISNPAFGLLISETGSGYTWSANSQRNRLTPWANDQTTDPSIEALYIRDEDTGAIWSPTAAPILDDRPYRVRHGQGYSVYEHNTHGIAHELVVFVPCGAGAADPVRIQRLRLKNNSGRTRSLSVTSYVEWVLGVDREGSQSDVCTSWNAATKAIFAVNHQRGIYAGNVAFQATSALVQSFTGDRSEFLGAGTPAAPAAMGKRVLQSRVGQGLDPCGAVRALIALEPGEQTEIVFLLGEAGSDDEARDLIARYTDLDAVYAALEQAQSWWDVCLGAIVVDTPDQGTNWLMNRWLLYQDISCRFWGRTALYQSGGAYGFRDQLQDAMALVYTRPEMTRAQILRAAARQFVEGDVQHWWFPDSGLGVRTRMSDDLIWLPYATAHYIRITGDIAILDEQLPFIRSEALPPGEHDRTEIPEIVPQTSSLIDHCRLALERGATIGRHGIPLIGTGDWNDGFSMVGAHGRGESVWLAWFLIHALNDFAYLLDLRGEHDEAELRRTMAKGYANSVEESCWDGEWYVRAFFDNGDPLGSSRSDEAKIDSLSQSWAVISAAGDPARSRTAIESAKKLLTSESANALLLFTPPFDKSRNNPGYIKGYVPGVRENGGQYTHGSLWLPMAFARVGDGDTAVDMLKLMSPIEHSSTQEDAQRYAVEPYVVAADIYSESTLAGRGGWTWYTGSAGWMYRVWLEEVLGFHKRGDTLQIKPVVPAAWPGFSMTFRNGLAVYAITVERRVDAEALQAPGLRTSSRQVGEETLAALTETHRSSGGAGTYVELDGQAVPGGVIPLVADVGEHTVRVVLG